MNPVNPPQRLTHQTHESISNFRYPLICHHRTVHQTKPLPKLHKAFVTMTASNCYNSHEQEKVQVSAVKAKREQQSGLEGQLVVRVCKYCEPETP